MFIINLQHYGPDLHAKWPQQQKCACGKRATTIRQVGEDALGCGMRLVKGVKKQLLGQKRRHYRYTCNEHKEAA